MKGALREEKVCLNCGAEVPGRYCPECGQENREPREPFGALLYHFFSDFTHFDSKLFITVKDLIIKPGFLTKEYLAGRRMRYLHPIRMYLFISFLFFFVMYLLSARSNDAAITVRTQHQTVTQLQAAIDTVNANIDTADAGRSAVSTVALSAAGKNLQKIDMLIDATRKYNSVKAFDAVQMRLPASKRLTGPYRFTARKAIAWKQKYGSQAREMALEKFLHLIPKVMFFLLPLFAVYLRWFYKRDHLYTDHIIFSLHFHSCAFLLMLSFMVLDALFAASFLKSLEMPLLFIYLVLALSNRYEESIVRSFFKGVGISIVYGFSISMGLVVAALLTFIIS